MISGLGLRLSFSYFYATVTFLWVLLSGYAHAIDLSATDKSIVRVVVYAPDFIGTGSGSVLNNQGYVLTNAHVIEGGQLFRVYLSVADGDEEPVLVEAQLVASSREKDLAILHAPSLNGIPLKLAKSTPDKGAEVHALGFPAASDDAMGAMASDYTYTSGNVSRTSVSVAWGLESGSQAETIQHTATINSGNSGGPLIDDCHRLVGVNTAGYNKANDVFLASSVVESVAFLRANNVTFQTDGTLCLTNNPNLSLNPLLKFGLLFNALLVLLLGFLIVLMFKRPREQLIQKVSEISRRTYPANHPASSAGYPNSHDAAKRKLINKKAMPAYGLRLKTLSGGQNIRFSAAEVAAGDGDLIIGRHPAFVDISINEPKLSKLHARFSWASDGYKVENLNSINGVSVNQIPLMAFEPKPVREGDIISFGKLSYHVTRH